MPELEIDILTTQPNRYRESSASAPALEITGNVRVFRLTLPEHDSGMHDQGLAFIAYARQGLRAIRSEGPYDAVFATSSRLMTASFATLVSRRLDLPLYLDIRDLFADTMTDVLPRWMATAFAPVIRALERWTFQSAGRINVVSEGFADYVRQVAPSTELRNFTNGIDDEFLSASPGRRPRNADAPPLIVYAGNVGEGQGLHRIIPEVARRLGDRVRFRVIGHGGRIQQLRAQVGDVTANVELLPPVPRAELHSHYADADILFLHLNDYPAFRKVLPSKIFEYAATGRPIAAGVAGYSAQFIREHVENAQVFPPCDVDGMIEAIEILSDSSAPVDRSPFLERYARRRITTAMAHDVAQFVHSNH
ncbi:hypothetical protein GCM10011494_07740 [Novosphingobium endophyticum]|uniref:Glycosyltransferase subfamily 4-like N-terminal domain-containing protein n=1 Tax=Novosphingobium endophyticum TaxID=1955250 RepID=A0A916X4U5_9SPHN|nr:hypothetical protein GCM10011494_07740 [Novosphingobium endophyticum]